MADTTGRYRTGPVAEKMRTRMNDLAFECSSWPTRLPLFWCQQRRAVSKQRFSPELTVSRDQMDCRNSGSTSQQQLRLQSLLRLRRQTFLKPSACFIQFVSIKYRKSLKCFNLRPCCRRQTFGDHFAVRVRQGYIQYNLEQRHHCCYNNNTINIQYISLIG